MRVSGFASQLANRPTSNTIDCVGLDSLPARIGGKYVPLRVIGTGGMGVVYEVEHMGTGELLALKVLRGHAIDLAQTTLDRFSREARVAAWVKSEHIVRVIDVGTATELGGNPFLVMDLLNGANLADATREEAQEPEDVVNWLAQVARGLDKAHAHGVVHRDLKPENLFLTQQPDAEPIIKILDFGVAKVRVEEDAQHTGSGEILGTPLYMAPEQARGDNDQIGPATDMWSLGLIAFRLLTGRDYWQAVNKNLLMVDILQKPIKAPSASGAKLGPGFDAWFLRSCDRNPSRRWVSVREQVGALADALQIKLEMRGSNPDPALAATQPQVLDPRRTSRSFVTRKSAPVLLIAVGGLLSLAFVVRFGQSLRPASPTIALPSTIAPRGPAAPSSSASAAHAPSEVQPPPAAPPSASANPSPNASAAGSANGPMLSAKRPPTAIPTAPNGTPVPGAAGAKSDPLADPK